MTDDTYDEFGVNTKNSFNTPPKAIINNYPDKDNSKREPLTEDELDALCPTYDDPMRREMWKIGYKAAHGIKENT